MKLKYGLEFSNIIEIVSDDLVKICKYLLEPRVIDGTHHISLKQKRVNHSLLEIQLYSEHLLIIREILNSSIKFACILTGFEFAHQNSVNEKNKVLVVVLIFHVTVVLIFSGNHLSHV